jgi:hypothetical protein
LGQLGIGRGVLLQELHTPESESSRSCSVERGWHTTLERVTKGGRSSVE